MCEEGEQTSNATIIDPLPLVVSKSNQRIILIISISFVEINTGFTLQHK